MIDGEPYEVGLNNEEQFLKDKKDLNPKLKYLKEGDNILTFYLFCPKWNGSVGHVKNIKVNKGVKINGIN